jgi:transglutaminase-like putative cysteine protease
MNPGGSRPLPARTLQLVVLGMLAIALTGLDLASSLSWPTLLLVVMAGLKLREARSLGERRLVALLELVAAGLLGAQLPGLLPSALQLLISVGALAGLLQLEIEQGLRWRQLLRQSALLLAATLPMAMALFVLVPRIGPLWTMPKGSGGAARTGLSGQLDPGGIATLTDNDAIAARVAFSDDRVLEPARRYWRVLVHDRFDGHQWDQRPRLATGRWAADAGSMGPREPQRELWLVEPDGLRAVPWDGRAQPSDADLLKLGVNGELISEQSGATRRSYQLISRAEAAPWQTWPPGPEDLALPAGSQPRLEALGRSWGGLVQPEARVAAAERWFRRQPFRYSRTPGRLPDQRGLDVFLFERREGFCGHYASAFTALMRAAGLPARVVSGYRGGAWVQPMGGQPFLEIRRRDAHAWSEVWLPQRGWVSVDPSLWIGSDTASGRGTGAAAVTDRWLWGQRQWSGLDLAWSRWWLGFDRERQETLLTRWMGGRRQWLGVWILGLCSAALALGVTAIQIAGRRPQKPRPGSRAERARLAAIRCIERLGVQPSPGETLETLCDRAAAQNPGSSAELSAIQAAWLELSFGRSVDAATTAHQCHQLEQAVRELRARTIVPQARESA